MGYDQTSKTTYDSLARAEFNKAVNDHKSSIIEIYHKASNKEETTSEWLAAEMDKALHPGKYNLIERQEAFFQTFESFIECRKMSDVRKQNFRVILRALQRFELYKRWCGSRDYHLTLGGITAKTLSEFEEFLRNEHLLAAKYPKIYKAVPETRPPQQRGQNTLNDIFTKLRTFYLWAVEMGMTENNPFKCFSVKECVYGTPYYITIEERNRLYHTRLHRHPSLAVQRDIFVFHCLIGCRISDLYRMTKRNIINGAIEYVARKTISGRPVTVRVPLNAIAQEILARYPEGERLLPFISEQKYNAAIKRMFLAARLKRPITVINPTTREPDIRPLNEIASSHLARRTFVGNLYKQVKDPSLVSALSGHKEGSRAFARYREIDEQMKLELVKMLE